jgi:hypothetical protein
MANCDDIYNLRDRSCYEAISYDPAYCRNEHILKWWNPAHDKVLAKQIENGLWYWYWGVTEEICKITNPKTIRIWRKADRLCRKYAWYNVLMYFAVSRAESLGLMKGIRKPKWKKCPLCNKKFVEDSLPYPIVKRLGVHHIDFCSPCLRNMVLSGSGDDSLPRLKTLDYLRNLSAVLQRIPHQGFGEGKGDFEDLGFRERLDLFRILKKKPTTSRVKRLFGSWFNALVQAGVLEEEVRRTTRGVHCLAKDGHVCLSLGEKTIDDFLFRNRIKHEKEVSYPEGNFKADFVVDGIFIEYFGLKGNAEYDAKSRLKDKLCMKHGIKLIRLYPADLANINVLEKKLLGVLGQNDLA